MKRWSAALQPRTSGRSSAKNASGNVAVVQTELKIGYIEASGVDRVVVWIIYEVRGDKIAVATLVGQRTDRQTAQYIKWSASQPKTQ